MGRSTIGLLGLLLGVTAAMAACGDDGDNDGATGPDQPTTTEPIPTTTGAAAQTSGGGSEPTGEPLLGDSRWVSLDFDRLVDDRGRVLLTAEDIALGSRVVERSLDGTVFVVTGVGLVRIAPGMTEPELVTDAEIRRLLRIDGDVVALTADGLVAAATGEPHPGPIPDEEPAVGGRVIASNGLIAEHVPGEFEFDEDGWISRVVRPEGVRVLDERGEPLGEWELGAPGAPLVNVIDFDGRHLLAARGPEEPALPTWDHVLIDLTPGGRAVEAFLAFPGAAALATADLATIPDPIAIAPIALCPTWSTGPPPAADPGLPADVLAGFERAALAIARCDTWTTRSAGAGIEWTDGASWRALSAALRGPSRLDGADRVWGYGTGATITIDERGTLTVDIAPQDLDGLWLTVTADHLGVEGTLGPASAARLMGVAESAAGRLGLEIWSGHLTTDGEELPELSLQALEELIGTSIGLSGDVDALEAHLARDRLRLWAATPDGEPIVGETTGAALAEAGIEVIERVDRTGDGPTALDRQIVADLVALATGDRAAADRIPWADEVNLAAGPLLGAVRRPGELGDPEAWDLRVGPFRGGGDEAISALATLARPGVEWGEPVVGPHLHCVSPAVPPPTPLAGLRRVSIQVVGFDSCIQWTTVDVFLDGADRVAGVSLDRWEP